MKDKGGEGARKLEAIAEIHEQKLIKKQIKGKVNHEVASNKLHVLQLDVTSEDDWQAAATYIRYLQHLF